jgi:hypothetical protein
VATAPSSATPIWEQRLNRREREILSAEIGAVEPRLAVRSKTRIDTGRWWCRTPLWVCVTEQDVVVLAAARRNYLQRFPIADCRASHYCHITGELVIEAGNELRFSRLAMSPTDALGVLNALDGRSPASAAAIAAAAED